jgi:outer membrane protein
MFKKAVFIIMTLILPMSIWAQSFKFAHLSSQDILVVMPEVIKAQSELQSLEKKYSDEIQRTSDEFQKKYQEFLQARDSLPQNISERRQRELQDMSQRSQQFQEDAQQIMLQKQQELMAPIYQKLDNAIKTVGEAQNVIYIFDISRTAIPYINTTQSIDVTSLVKTELGIK